jgi:4'-phosphopantetheinyl transferase
VWRVSLDVKSDPVQQAESILSADESQRAARFRFAEDRHRFIVSHIALRDVLSRYLHIRPEVINFTVGEYGKPAVVSKLKLDFNLSHSGDFALIGIARERKAGVDVERFREELEIEKIANRFFSENEIAELISLPSDQQLMGFFNCWTRKEAYIKAHGLGLSLPLDSFDVSLSPNGPAILRATRPDPQEVSRWTLLSLDIEDQYAGAVAVEGLDLDFRFWDWINA